MSLFGTGLRVLYSRCMKSSTFWMPWQRRILYRYKSLCGHLFVGNFLLFAWYYRNLALFFVVVLAITVLIVDLMHSSNLPKYLVRISDFMHLQSRPIGLRLRLGGREVFRDDSQVFFQRGNELAFAIRMIAQNKVLSTASGSAAFFSEVYKQTQHWCTRHLYTWVLPWSHPQYTQERCTSVVTKWCLRHYYHPFFNFWRSVVKSIG